MSTCEVDFSDLSDDAEQVEMFDSKRIVGRKEHRCEECGRAILKGESHTRVSYKFEGDFNTEHICDECQETAAEFEYRLCGGLLWESMAEAWENGAHVQACMNRLTTARAKEHLRQQYLKYKKLSGRSETPRS